jgi:threonine synthase
VITEWEGRAILMEHLAQHRGWFPAGLFMPFSISNPYGVEGYKTFAYEIWRELHEVPEHIFFPCARGNGLYGCWKGWKELQRYGLVNTVPRHHATQPEGAAPLVCSFEQGMRKSAVVDNPHSVAMSTRESVSSDQALDAIYASGGTAVSVDDDEILAAVKALGREGLCVEPASALPVAAVVKLANQERLYRDATIICVLTAAGIKWPLGMQAASPRAAVAVDPTPAELDRLLDSWGWR